MKKEDIEWLAHYYKIISEILYTPGELGPRPRYTSDESIEDKLERENKAEEGFDKITYPKTGKDMVKISREISTSLGKVATAILDFQDVLLKIKIDGSNKEVENSSYLQTGTLMMKMLATLSSEYFLAMHDDPIEYKEKEDEIVYSLNETGKISNLYEFCMTFISIFTVLMNGKLTDKMKARFLDHVKDGLIEASEKICSEYPELGDNYELLTSSMSEYPNAKVELFNLKKDDFMDDL